MGRRFVHWKSPLAVTMLFVLLIAAGSFVVTRQINDAEEEACFTRLAQEAGELAHSLEINVSSDREKLLLMAGMMSSDLGQPEEFLRLYQGTGTFLSRLELLLPGDEVITADGRRIDAAGKLSFEEEAAQGAHISNREQDLEGDGYVVRHFVPVEQEGEVVAILCGVIELGTLGEELPYAPYGGEAAVYVIDGATGDFLIDTWHAEMGNIWELGPRPMAAGYDDAQLRQGLVEGESNFVVFVSNTTGEHLYFYYTPLEINQWRVALSVPEDLVFAGARNIRGLLNLLLALECVACLLYIFWLVLYVRRETGEKQRQLDALSDIYEVEKLLFNAHEHRENVPRSLAVVARMLRARRVAFTMLAGDGTELAYIWEKGGESALGSALLAQAAPLAERFSAGRREVCAHTNQEVRTVLPGAPEEMEDLAAIPVEDGEGELRGVLSASGLTGGRESTAMLRSVAFSFAMLCGNTRTYREMQWQGERDALTQLYNRNRYELDLPKISAECRRGVCCVYLDANGLHEMNNSQGHQAGDEMLRAIAGELTARFDPRHIYRVGGDEFIIFVVDGDETETARCTGEVAGALERAGYHISAGTAWRAAPAEDLEGLVKTAEQRMYDAKRAYYRSPASTRRPR